MAATLAETIEPHPPMTPAEWAGEYRVLSRSESATPGPWRNSRTPYSVGIMDALALLGVVEVVILKSSQAGISEAVRNFIGWVAHLHPDPMMLVLPDEDVAKRMVKTRIQPLFDSTTPLRALRSNSSHDRTQSGLGLSNGFALRCAWSGSPASLASDPIRYVICDEVDKYPPFAGREASPIDLAEARTKTYADERKVVKLSSPTTREGAIWQAFAACDVQLYYYVPCHGCGHYQQVVFSQVKWDRGGLEDRDELARYIRLRKHVWYECVKCKCHWADADKQNSVRHGVWASEMIAGENGFNETAAEFPMGSIVDRLGDGGAARVGFQVSDLLCEWVSFWELAAEFVAGDTFYFVTNRLGRPHSTSTAKQAPLQFSEKVKRARLQPDVVPEWATALIATIDVQRDCFYYVVRAWGPESRSHRVSHGQVQTFDDLDRLFIQGQWPVENSDAPARCSAIGIDSGDGELTPDVYRFARRDPRIMPMKGSSTRMKEGKRPAWESNVTHKPRYGPSDPIEVTLRMFIPDYFKDLLSAWITRPGEPELWSLNSRDDDQYNRQMASEHRITEKRGRMRYETWVPVAEKAANHYWDCEVMQVALSTIINAHLFRPLKRAVAVTPSAGVPASRPVETPSRAPIRTNSRPIRTRY